MDCKKQQNDVKIKVIEDKRDKLIEKMKVKGTFEEYNSIKYKKIHEGIYKKVLLEYKKTWEYYETPKGSHNGCLSRVGFRNSKAENILRNYRDLSKPELYKNLPKHYFGFKN